ncbi:prepilin peptidase [Undibacterium curvum]|uniref:Prepilin leader peptidase/N-methyltransferase n=1 Tax=Undibacterium curvum TaxID=2762294 RepID=A0ABR7A2C0_9BURK|nr:A24 family peptidase [Undibacterium curvum]MBC3930984.1 prepilin peptidase [Undibacterium curvum]
MLQEIFFQPAANWFGTFCFGLIGLLTGSFLNVVIYRLPKMMQRQFDNDLAEELGKQPPHTERYNLVVPRSACPHCGHQIRAWENIPVVSYLLIGGKCTSCKAHISVRYPLVEMITGALAAAMAWHFGTGVTGMAATVFCFFLITLTLIDADTQFLPDDLTYSLLWLGMLLSLTGAFSSPAASVLGAVAGYLSLWLVFHLYRLLTGKEGFGYGDFKMLAALGAWLGWQMLPLIILLSSLVGSVVGITLILLSKMGFETKLSFGPYLAMAGLIAMLWGPQIVQAYLSHL